MNDHVTCQDSRQRLVLDVVLELEVASHVAVARQVVEHEVRVPNRGARTGGALIGIKRHGFNEFD